MCYTDQSFFFCVLFDNVGIFFLSAIEYKGRWQTYNTVQKWKPSDKCEIMENLQNAVIWEL